MAFQDDLLKQVQDQSSTDEGLVALLQGLRDQVSLAMSGSSVQEGLVQKVDAIFLGVIGAADDFATALTDSGGDQRETDQAQTQQPQIVDAAKAQQQENLPQEGDKNFQLGRSTAVPEQAASHDEFAPHGDPNAPGNDTGKP